MRLVLVAGNTATARIDGISAAGADAETMAHTPAADLELVTYGATVRAPAVPVSPSGCPTPAVVTRVARELLDVAVLPVDAGLARPTAAPTLELGGAPGGDVREPEPVPDAGETFRAARRLGRDLPDDELLVGETVPGGTTTALGTLAALGERTAVSSSLPDNPLALKRSTVRAGLSASDVAEGELAGEPVEAVRRMGDPVLAAIAGLVVGATGAGTDVTLAGGTQLAAAAALARHAGADAPLALATTAFLARDDAAPMAEFAADLDLDVTVTDPRFERRNHPALAGFVAGEAKEGVGMGGALALADRADASMAALRERVVAVYDRLDLGATEERADGPAGEP